MGLSVLEENLLLFFYYKKLILLAYILYLRESFYCIFKKTLSICASNKISPLTVVKIAGARLKLTLMVTSSQERKPQREAMLQLFVTVQQVEDLYPSVV